MRKWLAVVAVVAFAGCNPQSCNPVSKTSQSAYAAQISLEGQKALGEAMQMVERGYPSMAMSKLAEWDRKAADAIQKIEKDPTLTPADRRELLRKTNEVRESVSELIRSIAAGNELRHP